ncbi:MAG TPA: DUF559 domain-containing protein [bacterium]|nr:DUF559 domain-containing protein [bacterium]HPS29201.1 DUF559 domain-containing protein [bacterium]
MRIDTLSGDFKIYQPVEGQRYSTDDLLTAWMAIICSSDNPPERFLDLGSGLCSVPMIVMWKFSELTGVGIELRDNRRELGLKSLEMNGLEDRFELKSGDLRELRLDEKFSLITSTPPYYTESEGPLSPHDDKSAARFELNGSIEDYFQTADRHLCEKGKFITVYPYAYRERVYKACEKCSMSVMKRTDIIPRDGKPPLISLFACSCNESIEAVNTLTIRDEKGNYTQEYKEVRNDCGFKMKPETSGPHPNPSPKGEGAERTPRVIGAVKNKEVYEHLYPAAIQMREIPTVAEKILWSELRGSKLGVKFRRQHIIDRFIVDFYCVEKALIVEVDGEIHLQQKERDEERETILKAMGCEIIRFRNSEVENDIEKVIQKIKEYL